MYQPEIKHKAQHGGYIKRPTKGQVVGLMMLYQGVSNVVVKSKSVKKQVGVQLKLEF